MLEPRVRMRRLESRITAFEEQPIVKNKILFYGDSSFTRWKEKYGNPNLEDVFRMQDGYQAVVNHGFGSSTAEEQLYYYPRAVRPWEPRALVLLAFGNDDGYAYSPAEVLALQTRILDYARADFEEIELFLCNVCPELAQREADKAARRRINEYNGLVSDYCAKHEDVTEVDHNACADFFEDGKAGDFDAIRADIFIEDKVHFNAQGYAIYEKFFRQYLNDLL